MKYRYFLSLFVIIGVYACSTPEQTVKTEEKKEPEVYVFDDVSSVDTTAVPPPPPAAETIPVQQPVKNKIFMVQVGAFSTLERAQLFVNSNKDKTDQKFDISFSSEVQLFVVRSVPFNTREEAEKVRNQLQLAPIFRDSFIITADAE